MMYHHLQGKEKREREEGETDRYKNTQSSRRGGTNHDPAHHHRVQNVFHLVHQPIKSVLTLYHHLQGKEKRERRNRSSQNNKGYKNTQLSLFTSGQLGVLVTPVFLGHLWLMMAHSKRICTTYDACFQFLSCSLPETPTADIHILEWE